jgi:hypothetical protein
MRWRSTRTFEQFHNDELVDEADAALARGFFHDWIAAYAPELPLGVQECVGYRVPLFLGGADDVSNLEPSVLAVYWSLCGQLRTRTVELPPGTPIHGVRIDTDSAE